MAVTRAGKEQELQEPGRRRSTRVDTAILVDYRGLNVPQVTELRRQLRGRQGAPTASIKNTLAKRASQGTQAVVARDALRRDDGDRLHRTTDAGGGMAEDVDDAS